MSDPSALDRAPRAGRGPSALAPCNGAMRLGRLRDGFFAISNRRIAGGGSTMAHPVIHAPRIPTSHQNRPAPKDCMDKLFAILVLLLLGWYWLDSLRAREMATEICRTACERQQLQLLDQTVALRRLGLRRTEAGLRLRRLYRFDFSVEGVGRRSGYLVLIGLDLERIGLDLQDRSAEG